MNERRIDDWCTYLDIVTISLMVEKMKMFEVLCSKYLAILVRVL